MFYMFVYMLLYVVILYHVVALKRAHAGWPATNYIRVCIYIYIQREGEREIEHIHYIYIYV